MNYDYINCTAADIPLDLSDPAKCQIQGFLRQELTLGHSRRSLLTFISKEARSNDPCIVVAPPSDLDPVTFLHAYGWISFAEKHHCFISVLIPENQKWDDQGLDADFLNCAYKKVQSREYFTAMQDCIYLFGFGDGASIAQQAAMKMTSEWAGLATFGSFSPRVMQNAGQCRDTDAGQQDGELYIAAEKSQLPVWILTSDIGKQEESVIKYWKNENKNQAEPVFDAKGCAIYLPPLYQKTSSLNEEQIAQTRVSQGITSASVNASLLSYVWEYIGKARRHRSYGRKVLRYYRNPEECGAVRHTMTVDQICREWYEYVPESCRHSENPVPLVVVMHGRGGNGQSFFDISCMSQVAEERGFIAVFPTSDFYTFQKTGMKNLAVWQGNLDGKQLNSLSFIRQMIDDVKRRNAVDASRIYACGQSSGGYMTTYLALAAPELFAAVSPWSGFTFPDMKHADFRYHEADCFQNGHVPIMLLFGDKDSIFGTDSLNPLPPESSDIGNFIRFLIREYRLNDTPKQYTCTPIHYYIWENQLGTPMLKIGIVHDMPHANYAEESRIAYDEYFSRFSRVNGTLLYLGAPAEI